MASANSLKQNSPSDSAEDVYALIEQSFFGDGGAPSVSVVQNAFRHHFNVVGNGSRIVLTRQCAQALGIEECDICCLASAVECLHNASLVQDDLQDQSALRRGQPSVVAHFGSDVALGLTDQLITTAFVCLAGVSATKRLPQLISQINRAVSETVDGQTRELSGRLNGCAVDAYLCAAKKKSGPLFALSLELPLIFANHAASVEAAHEIACQFGLGYQILDDLKDRKSDPQTECSGNIVFALQETENNQTALKSAAVMAEQLLREASDRARLLPFGCGSPLIDLVDRLLPQVDAFKS